MVDEFQSEPDRIAPRFQEAGLSGAGGAGFPSYVKWNSIDNVDYLLVNHQESEPNCFVDKWIGTEYAEELAVTNEIYEDLIAKSKPAVEFGTDVTAGQIVAEPQKEGRGFSVAHHAPIAGEVSDVTPREVEIRRHGI